MMTRSSFLQSALMIAALVLLGACSTQQTVAPGTTPGAATSIAPATTSPSARSAAAATTTTTTTTATTTTTTTRTTTTTTTTTGAPGTLASTTAIAPGGPLTIQQLLDLGRPIVLAHAAGEDEHPHSTPYGYGESVAAGVDMLDFDVQLTADGVLVVQHDESTGRTTNIDLRVAETNYADLAKLDNAYWFSAECTCTGRPDAAYTLRGIRTGSVPPPSGYTPDDFIIPRFTDIAERFPNMPVNIEIKGNGDHAVAAATELAKELTDLDLLDNAVVTSFDDAVVDAFHAVAPTVEVTPGLNISAAWILGGTPLPTGMRILQLPPEFNGVDVLTPSSIAASHFAGYVIWVWPNDRALENPQGYAKLLQMGMDGLNINFPEQGVAAVRGFIPETL